MTLLKFYREIDAEDEGGGDDGEEFEDGEQLHLNQTQMKAKTSAKGVYAKSTCTSIPMYVTYL